MFGGGNIGRGFIGQLFSESGYEVVFVDVVQELLDLFNREHHYRLQTVSNEGSKDYSIGPVSGVDSRNQAAVAEAVAEASICATAVGANVLKFVAPNLAVGLALRAKRNLPPINVIVCENLHGLCIGGAEVVRVAAIHVRRALAVAESRKYQAQ